MRKEIVKSYIKRKKLSVKEIIFRSRKKTLVKEKISVVGKNFLLCLKIYRCGEKISAMR